MAQLTMLDNNYPGGLKAYLSRAKTLLSQAASGANALQGYTPSIPEGHDLEVGSATFLERERRGAVEGKRIAYVLVAGGLGERLGYSGIKLELPSDSLTRKPFLQLYIEHILALDAAAAASGADEPGAELVLMVSGDTDGPTRELLRANNHFGMPSDRITIVRQEKVPSLADNEAHLALKDGRGVQTKPHGHGDVHTLLHKAGAERWVANGIKWVVFSGYECTHVSQSPSHDWHQRNVRYFDELCMRRAQGRRGCGRHDARQAVRKSRSTLSTTKSRRC